MVLVCFGCKNVYSMQVKSIQLDVTVGKKKISIRDRLNMILSRNIEMFNKKLVLRTSLLLVIYFALSFG